MALRRFPTKTFSSVGICVALVLAFATEPTSSAPNAVTELDKVPSLSTRQLRHILIENHAECKGCIERRHLVERALEVLRSRTEGTVSQLTEVQHSVKQHFQDHHFSLENNVKVPLGDFDLELPDIRINPNVECEQPFDNETVYCRPRASTF